MKNARRGVMVIAMILLIALPAQGVSATPVRQTGQLIPDGLYEGDNFGFALALSADGNTAIVGMRGRSNYTGAASVFTKTGGMWGETVKLTARDGVEGDFFGVSVALSADGNTALVGAYSAHGRTGAAYVFTQVNGGGWLQRSQLIAADGRAGESFGAAVALNTDGTLAAVGAPNAGDMGVTYLFGKGDNGWGAQARLTSSAAQVKDAFGASVSISGDGNLLLVGATGRSTNTGTVYVFGRANSSGNDWAQTGQLSAGDGAAGDFFGWSVAMSADGTAAVIGTPNRAMYRGTAYLFSRGETSWSQSAALSVSDGRANDRFGNSVAISADGGVVIVGAPNKNRQTGTAYVFGRIGSGRDGTYTQQSKLTADDSVPSDRYGAAVAVSRDGTTALIGAAEHSGTSGVAYVYG